MSSLCKQQRGVIQSIIINRHIKTTSEKIEVFVGNYLTDLGFTVTESLLLNSLLLITTTGVKKGSRGILSRGRSIIILCSEQLLLTYGE